MRIISYLLIIVVVVILLFALHTPARETNSIGLGFDIVGAILIFVYGLPAKFDPEGHTHIITHEIDQEEVKKGRIHKARSEFGVFFLFLGFLFQLISNYV